MMIKNTKQPKTIIIKKKTRDHASEYEQNKQKLASPTMKMPKRNKQWSFVSRGCIYAAQKKIKIFLNSLKKLDHRSTKKEKINQSNVSFTRFNMNNKLCCVMYSTSRQKTISVLQPGRRIVWHNDHSNEGNKPMTRLYRKLK